MTDRPQPLKLAMINLYKLDKSTCCKHIASESRSSISYRSRDEKACKQSAAGKKVKVKFMVKELKREEWFVGIISSYNGLKGEYGIHFPCDNKTVNMKLDDDDLVFLQE